MELVSVRVVRVWGQVVPEVGLVWVEEGPAWEEVELEVEPVLVGVVEEEASLRVWAEEVVGWV